MVSLKKNNLPKAKWVKFYDLMSTPSSWADWKLFMGSCLILEWILGVLLKFQKNSSKVHFIT